MPAFSFRPRLRASALIALTSAMTIGVTQFPVAAQAASMTMPMASSAPEQVSAALTALNQGKKDQARTDLLAAIKSTAEPKDARGHASESLAALNVGNLAMAKVHAVNGAGVEHFTYALRALSAGQAKAARGHLGEALKLPKVKVRAQAKAAIAAIKHGNRARARRAIIAGLAASNSE